MARPQWVRASAVKLELAIDLALARAAKKVGAPVPLSIDGRAEIEEIIWEEFTKSGALSTQEGE